MGNELNELTHSVELRAVEFAPEIERFAIVFAEADGATHRMEMPIWAAHQLARALPRVGVPLQPEAPVSGDGGAARRVRRR